MTALQKVIHASFALSYGIVMVFGVIAIGFFVVPGFAGISPLSTDASHLSVMVHTTFTVYLMVLGMNVYLVWLKGKYEFNSFLINQAVFWAVIPFVLWFLVWDLPVQVTITAMVFGAGILKYLTITK